MKVVCTDNYDRDYKPNIVIAENVQPYMAERIVKLLNEDPLRNDEYWFAVKPDDYVPPTLEDLYL